MYFDSFLIQLTEMHQIFSLLRGNTYQPGNRLWHNTGASPSTECLRLLSLSLFTFFTPLPAACFFVSTTIPVVPALPADSDQRKGCLKLFCCAAIFLCAVICLDFSGKDPAWCQTECHSDSEVLNLLGVERFTKSTVWFISQFCDHSFWFGSVYADR